LSSGNLLLHGHGRARWRVSHEALVGKFTDSGNSVKRLCLALLFSALAMQARADLIPGPPPGENVLLIYTNITGYNTQLKDSFKTALIAAGATVTELLNQRGRRRQPRLLQRAGGPDRPGQPAQLVPGLRPALRDDKNNLGFTGQAQET